MDGRRNYLCIDPGMNGGLAWRTPKGVEFAKLNDSVHDVANLLKFAIERNNISHIIMEAVHAMPGQGVTSMFTFGKSVGRLEGVLATYPNLIVEYTQPIAWMRVLGVPPKLALSVRKRFIHDKAKSVCPSVPLQCGDAVGMLLAQEARGGIFE